LPIVDGGFVAVEKSMVLVLRFFNFHKKSRGTIVVPKYFFLALNKNRHGGVGKSENEHTKQSELHADV
jgi:hypothetical protein